MSKVWSPIILYYVYYQCLVVAMDLLREGFLGCGPTFENLVLVSWVQQTQEQGWYQTGLCHEVWKLAEHAQLEDS